MYILKLLPLKTHSMPAQSQHERDVHKNKAKLLRNGFYHLMIQNTILYDTDATAVEHLYALEILCDTAIGLPCWFSLHP